MLTIRPTAAQPPAEPSRVAAALARVITAAAAIRARAAELRADAAAEIADEPPIAALERLIDGPAYRCTAEGRPGRLAPWLLTAWTRAGGGPAADPSTMSRHGRHDNQAVNLGEGVPDANMCIRMRYKVNGVHVHVRVFTACSPGDTFANAGALTFRIDEWPIIRAKLEPMVEFIMEETVVAGTGSKK